jgi:hypothetical protein
MTLGALMELLKKVCDASAVNKMSPGNLGIGMRLRFFSDRLTRCSVGSQPHSAESGDSRDVDPKD